MFDIGFWELALIGVVALLVVGPDRLPGLARTVGLWVGRIRRYVASVRDDIEREIQADELKRMLEKPEELNPLKEVVEATTGSIGDAKKELADVQKSAEALMSDDADAEPTPTRSAGAPRSVDENGAEEQSISPTDATTAVGEAMTSGGDAATGPANEAVEDTREDERRSG